MRSATLSSTFSSSKSTRLDGQLAGLDLREVEDVVDDAEQVLAGALDLREVVALLRRRASVFSARWDMPMIAFIGVRISWLMLARKSAFVCAASSASSLAWRSASSARLRAG